jgi:hypothetical protein
MTTIVIQNGQMQRVTKVQRTEKKFNLMLGLKRISLISFNAVCNYFGIETKGDKILFFGFYTFCSLNILLAMIIKGMN